MPYLCQLLTTKAAGVGYPGAPLGEHEWIHARQFWAEAISLPFPWLGGGAAHPLL